MGDELDTFDTSYREEVESKPFVLFHPVRVVSVRGFMQTRLAKEYREYAYVGIDDTTPFTSEIDCGEGMSLKQRELQKEMLQRTSRNVVSSTSKEFYSTMDSALQRVVFGSCNSQERPQELLQAVNKYVNGSKNDGKKADLFVWLGDAVYLDRAGSGGFTREPQSVVSMRADWQRQLYRREYCFQRSQVPIIATIDDHDYSVNDMHAYNNPFKGETRQMFLDFLDLPDARQLGYAREWHSLVKSTVGRSKPFRSIVDSTEKYHASISPVVFKEYNVYNKYTVPDLVDPNIIKKDKLQDQDAIDYLVKEYQTRRTREGVYYSHVYGPIGKRMKIILLDVRTHQHIVKPGSPFADADKESVLGEEQWAWLDQELSDAVAPTNSMEYARGGAELVFIVSGIEMVSWGKLITEGWRTFPKDRTRQLSLVGDAGKQSYITSAKEGKKPTGFIFISGDVHFSEFQHTFYPINETQAVYSQGISTVGSGQTVVQDLKEYLQNTNDNTNNNNSISTNTSAMNDNAIDDMQTRSYLLPAVEITTSGMTHGLGEMIGQQTIFGNLIPIATSQQLRHDTMEFRADRDYSTVWSSIIGEKQPKYQKAQYFRHNFFTVDVDWEKDTITMDVRNKEGQSGMHYKVPLAFLRVLDISAIKQPYTLQQPSGVIASLDNKAGKAYLTRAQEQSTLEIGERQQKPHTWLIVEDLQAQSAWLKAYGWILKSMMMLILLGLFGIVAFGKKNNDTYIGQGIGFIQQFGGQYRYYCCGQCIRDGKKKGEKQAITNKYTSINNNHTNNLDTEDEYTDDSTFYTEDEDEETDHPAQPKSNTIEMSALTPNSSDSSTNSTLPKNHSEQLYRRNEQLRRSELEEQDRVLRFQMKLEKKEILRQQRTKIPHQLPQNDALTESNITDAQQLRKKKKIRRKEQPGNRAFQDKWFNKIKE